MEENSFKNKKNLQGRTFNFAVEIIKLLKEVKYSKENDVIKYQLAKSATSVGVNYSPC